MWRVGGGNTLGGESKRWQHIREEESEGCSLARENLMGDTLGRESKRL